MADKQEIKEEARKRLDALGDKFDQLKQDVQQRVEQGSLEAEKADAWLDKKRAEMRMKKQDIEQELTKKSEESNVDWNDVKNRTMNALDAIGNGLSNAWDELKNTSKKS